MHPMSSAPRNLERSVQINLRVTLEERQKFETASRANGLSLSAWMRFVALKAFDPDVTEIVAVPRLVAGAQKMGERGVFSPSGSGGRHGVKTGLPAEPDEFVVNLADSFQETAEIIRAHKPISHDLPAIPPYRRNKRGPRFRASSPDAVDKGVSLGARLIDPVK